MKNKIKDTIKVLKQVYSFRIEHHLNSAEVIEMTTARDLMEKIDTLLEIPEKKWTDEMWLDYYKARNFAKNNTVYTIYSLQESNV